MWDSLSAILDLKLNVVNLIKTYCITRLKGSICAQQESNPIVKVISNVNDSACVERFLMQRDVFNNDRIIYYSKVVSNSVNSVHSWFTAG